MLVVIDIIDEKIDEATRRYLDINEKELEGIDLTNYETLGFYIGRREGRTFNVNRNMLSYVDAMIVNYSKGNSVWHINRHLNQEYRETSGCFFKFTDIRKLLEEVQEIIKNIRPQYSNLLNVYRMRLDTPVGFNGGVVTSDIGVTTLLGTKDIITMYPVRLSREFNTENNQEDFNGRGV